MNVENGNPEGRMDNVENSQPKKSIGKIIGGVIIAILLLGLLGSCVGGNSSKSTSSTNNSETAVAESNASNPDNIKIKKCKVSTTSYGDKVAYVTYEWTNNHDDKRSFVYTHTAKAYQNGVEIADTIIGDNEPNEDLNDIKPGVTQTFTECYKLKNTKDKVDVEVTGFLSDDIIVSKSFTIK